jgi:hypothetical protein
MAFSLFTTTVEQILEDVAYALVEPVVNTTLGTDLPLRGVNTVIPASMAGIFVGAYLLVDTGPNQEQVIVTAVSSGAPLPTFTAYFANLHSASAPVVGATFPSGAPDHPLFTQNEMLAYLAEVQNEFLLKTRCIFGVTGTFFEPVNLVLESQQRFYQQPLTAIRVERVARVITGLPIMDLYETSQADLDRDNFSWESDSDVPKQWFRDQTNTAMFGITPMPNVEGSLELWYSKRGSIGNQNAVFLSDVLLVPDVMAHYIKY